MSLDITIVLKTADELNAVIESLDWAYDDSCDILASVDRSDTDGGFDANGRFRSLTALRAVLVRLTGNINLNHPKMPKHLRHTKGE